MSTYEGTYRHNDHNTYVHLRVEAGDRDAAAGFLRALTPAGWTYVATTRVGDGQ